MPSAKCGGFANEEVGKFLVVRRDGTVPKWTWFVLGARDPHAAVALRAYAASVRDEAMSISDEYRGALLTYAFDVEGVASEFDRERAKTGDGDPEKGPHRKDNEAILYLMKSGGEADLRHLDMDSLSVKGGS